MCSFSLHLENHLTSSSKVGKCWQMFASDSCFLRSNGNRAQRLHLGSACSGVRSDQAEIRSLFMVKKSIESGSKARRFGAIHRDWKNKQSGKKDSNRMKMTKVENGLPLQLTSRNFAATGAAHGRCHPLPTHPSTFG